MATNNEKTTPVVEKDTVDTTPPVIDPATDSNVAAPSSTENETPPVEDDAPEVEQVEVSESMKRAELDDVAAEAGLASVKSYKDKATVVDAINRVRAGADVNAVNEELAPSVDDSGDKVEVTILAPFYDLEGKATRYAGTTYQTTQARASELRGRKLVK